MAICIRLSVQRTESLPTYAGETNEQRISREECNSLLFGFEKYNILELFVCRDLQIEITSNKQNNSFQLMHNSYNLQLIL